MSRFKKILVAMDFSESSDFALNRAIEIASKNNAEITLLHVVEKKSLDVFLDQNLKKILPKDLWITTEEYYSNLLQEKINTIPNKNIVIKKMLISSGKPSIKILSYANKNKFDLIVIGAHGKYTLRDTFVGTTAEYIAEKARCPILIVKNKPEKSYNNIIIPIDFSKVSKNALKLATQLFPHSTIEIFHAGDYEFEKLLKKEEEADTIPKRKLAELKKSILYYLEDKIKKFKQSIKAKNQKISYSISLGYPTTTILKESEKKNRDMIIMGTQGHGQLHYILMGRVAHAILRETTKDILLVPPKQ